MLQNCCWLSTTEYPSTKDLDSFCKKAINRETSATSDLIEYQCRIRYSRSNERISCSAHRQYDIAGVSRGRISPTSILRISFRPTTPSGSPWIRLLLQMRHSVPMLSAIGDIRANTHSHTHTHTHTHTNTHTHMHTLSLTLSYTHSLSHTHLTSHSRFD